MRDSRTLWVSDDEAWAVAFAKDIPRGVMVGYYFNGGGGGNSLLWAIKDASADHLTGRAGFEHVGPTMHPADVCKVRRLDLPWEVAAPHPAYSVHSVSPRVVKDWPLACPRCHRAESAVLLFNTYDCKHGCYARKGAL